jgi:hypothetical protein
MILALDPTMSAIGAALFDYDGNLLGVSCIKPDKAATTPEEKARSMGAQVSELIEKHQVGDIVAEVTHGYIRNGDAAKSIYKAEGGVQFLAGAFGVRYHKVSIYDPKEVAVGRKTGVDKHEMIAAALKLKPIPPLSRKRDSSIHIGKAEHEADAIFIGLAYFRKRRFK